jgi:beta-lactamase regulating signal transducer with metallopeptidase domain
VLNLLTLGLTNALFATVLALFVAGLGRILDRRPAARHLAWLLVLVKLVTPPLVNVPLLPPDREPQFIEPVVVHLSQVTPEAIEIERPIEISTVGLLASGPTVVADEPAGIRWKELGPTAIGGVWLAGSLITLMLAAVRIQRFRRLLRDSEPASYEVQNQVAKLAARLGLKRVPEAWWIDARVTPMLWAVGVRPRLILPRHLWKGLDGRQRSMLLVHELAHLRRGDHRIRLFELAVTSLYWWFPVTWWARHALRDAEEQCCDAWVVWIFPEESRTYAETLLETIDFLNPTGFVEPLLASGFGRVRHLRRRLTMIMLGSTPRTLGWRGALAALSLSALLLPIHPIWAQKASDEPDRRAQGTETIEIRGPGEVSYANVHEGSKADIEVTRPAITLRVATDGKESRIEGGSIEEVIKILEKRIQILKKEKEEGGKDSTEDHIRALNKAVEDLRKARPTLANSHATALFPRADSTNLSTHPAVVYRLAGVHGNLNNPEQNARIEKARARIESIRKELTSKQKELADAEQELAKLGGFFSWGTEPVRFQMEMVPAPLEHVTVQNRVVSRPVKASGATLSGKKDSERIESLEKKLADLLKEVKDLKDRQTRDR